MMKLQNIKWLSVAFGLMASVVLMAQELPRLPDDPAVTRGKLPNGTTYFIVENPIIKGTADFALVQRTGTETSDEPGDPVTIARDALAGKSFIRTGRPQSFFLDHGVVPGERGYVNVFENATVFRFEDMIISGQTDLMDSTLLILAEIIDRVTVCEDPYLRKWYAPSDQAVIISGDVNASEVEERLKYISYMTPRFPSAPRKEYKWEGHDDAVLICGEDSEDGLAMIKATWISPRTPEEFMNTVQPVVYEMYVTELGIIARHRIEEELRKRNIPYADVQFRQTGSVDSLGDESFMVSVRLASEDAEKAVAVIGETMAALDSGNALYSELQDAKSVYMRNARSSGLNDVQNSEYIDRCIAAFLYNASITSDKDRLGFYLSRDMHPDTELRLFNGIASALLDRKENLTLSCMSDGFLDNDQERLRDVFNESWEKGTMYEAGEPAVTDTISLLCPVEKMKLKSSRRDHMSGGQIWTFANGFKVIHKHIPSDGTIYYSLSLNGGYGSIGDLSKGEGAFMSDYLGLCRIGGLPGRTFMKVLENEGVVMNSKVNLSNTIISGEAPEDKLEFLIHALLTVTGSREHDPDAFDFYLRSENLRLEAGRDDRIAVIDSLMCPDYIYSPCKSVGVLTDSFAQKADRFYEECFSKVNDGVLVLVGDYDEFQLKKMLLSYSGLFRTKDKAFARPSVRYQPVSGWSTYTVAGNENSVDIVMTALMPLTAENHMAAAVASMVLKHRLAGVLSNDGIHMRFSYDCRIYPQERFNVMISLKEAPIDGFASDARHRSPIEAVDDIRDVLSGIDSIHLSDIELNAYKNRVKALMDAQMDTPEYWLKAISKRYLDGKDFTTSYEEKIDAVSADKVKELLSLLCSGSGIEYITIK